VIPEDLHKLGEGSKSTVPMRGRRPNQKHPYFQPVRSKRALMQHIGFIDEAHCCFLPAAQKLH